VKTDTGEPVVIGEFVEVPRIGSREAHDRLIWVADRAYLDSRLVVESQDEVVHDRSEVLVFVDDDPRVSGGEKVSDPGGLPNKVERSNDHGLIIDEIEVDEALFEPARHLNSFWTESLKVFLRRNGASDPRNHRLLGPAATPISNVQLVEASRKNGQRSRVIRDTGRPGQRSAGQ